MAIWNLGSINADYIYQVPHLPAPGETLSSTDRQMFLGGKGANMSVAAARAGVHVHHIGAVGPDGGWAIDRLLEYGVDTRCIAQVDTETAHALVFVDPAAENSIVVHPGSNRAIPLDWLKQSLTQAETGDWFITQNEVSLQMEAAELARNMGLKVAYAAAPFDAEVTMALLPQLDFLILNEVEADQLKQATGKDISALGVRDVIVTLGAQGAVWHGVDGAVQVDAIPVAPVDTTGAGDTFTGYVLAGLDRGQPMKQAMQMATKAAALMVTRQGTADVIPDLAEVRSFLS